MYQKRRALALFFAVFLVNTTYGLFDDPLIKPAGFFDDIMDENRPENRGKSLGQRFFNRMVNGPDDHRGIGILEEDNYRNYYG